MNVIVLPVLLHSLQSMKACLKARTTMEHLWRFHFENYRQKKFDNSSELCLANLSLFWSIRYGKQHS